MAAEFAHGEAQGASRRERAKAGCVRQPADLDAAKECAAGDVNERQQRGLVVGGARNHGAGMDREAEALEQVHGRVMGRGLAAIHEIFRGAMKSGVIDDAAHIQLQKPM